ncbi:MAG: CopM family metallochaperone [Beijerinckiaceae bacterium]
MKRIMTSLAVAAAVAFPAAAQQNHSGHGQPAPQQAPAPPAGQGMHGQMHGNMPGGMGGRMQGKHGQAAVPSDPASQAFAAANARMHKDMAIEFTGNADTDFVRGMIPHHQGAVDVAEIVLKFGKDAEVRKLATDIITAQKTEIAQMQAWLLKNSSAAAGPKAKAVIEAFEEVNAEMHKAMDGGLTGNADVDFITGMIPHHEGAVEMAKVLLRHGGHPELLKLAEDVVRSQSAEIVMMIGWQRRNGG